MKRLETLILFGLIALSGCRRVGALPPDDVLRRATSAGAQMQSAEFDAVIDATIASPRLSGRAEMHGTLARAGHEAAFSLSLNGSSLQKVGAADSRTNIQLAADVVTETDVIYVLLHTFTVDPQPPALHGVAGMLGSWWSLPRAGGSSGPALTPDPEFLRSQAAAVHVQRDLGLERINDRDAYHYAVTLDSEALIALMASTAEKNGEPFNAAETKALLDQYDAVGELWIDAETFLPHRLRWTIDQKEPKGATHIQFSADLRNHNAAPPIVVPTDAKPVDSSALLPMLTLPSSAPITP